MFPPGSNILGKLASHALWPTIALACIGILAVMIHRGREAARREARESAARMQEIMDRQFDDALESVRSGWSDEIGQTNYSGPGTDQRMQRAAAAVPQLKSVILEMTDITDEGIRHLAGLPNLETLAVFAGNVSDEGLGYLSGKRSLKNIVLDQTSVTEAGIAGLKTLPNLRLLAYYQDVIGAVPPGFGEARISALEQLGQLEEIRIGGNWVSQETLGRLQASLPGAKITRVENSDSLPYRHYSK